jgi:hypothetical protein
MASVAVVLELPARPEPAEPEPDTIVITNMEDFSADNKCSCAASDDNPY